MPTKRSLNKLERKAHMNIHVTKDVTEESEKRPLAGFTRDRLGKRHGFEPIRKK